MNEPYVVCLLVLEKKEAQWVKLHAMTCWTRIMIQMTIVVSSWIVSSMADVLDVDDLAKLVVMSLVSIIVCCISPMVLKEKIRVMLIFDSNGCKWEINP